MSDPVNDILLERARQTNVEGYTREHDDAHTDGELAQAAMAYLQASFSRPDADYDDYAFWWPADWSPMKRKSRREDLVRAGALILAEIERFDRSDERPSPTKSGE